MNMPTSPVHNLPFKSTTTASISVNSAKATTETRARTEVLSRQIPMSKNDSGLNPRTSRPATAVATKTASTEVRPSSDQYTSSRCRINANSSSTRAAPIPKMIPAAVN